MAVDKVCINLFYFPKKRLALEAVVLYRKQAALVNLAFFDYSTAIMDFSVPAHDFLFGAYSFACLVKKYTSCGNLDFGFR